MIGHASAAQPGEGGTPRVRIFLGVTRGRVKRTDTFARARIERYRIDNVATSIPHAHPAAIA